MGQEHGGIPIPGLPHGSNTNHRPLIFWHKKFAKIKHTSQDNEGTGGGRGYS